MNSLHEFNSKHTSQEGFLCTSLNKNLALSFAEINKKEYDQLKDDYISLLLKIELKQNKNLFVYDEHTHVFPNEQEVLL